MQLEWVFRDRDVDVERMLEDEFGVIAVWNLLKLSANRVNVKVLGIRCHVPWQSLVARDSEEEVVQSRSRLVQTGLYDLRPRVLECW